MVVQMGPSKVNRMGSYTSQSRSLGEVLSEARGLYRLQRHRADEMVGHALDHVRGVEELLREQYGFELVGKDVLDIGAGQLLLHLHYFGMRNRAVGIDFDVVAQGAHPGQYLRMLRFNGPLRTVKTIARKALGIDRKCRRALAEQLGVPSLAQPDVLQMDASSMGFDDASFDFVHCLSVFHHLPDPGSALEGICRVLRPGGTAYISFHLYSSETGSLDPRAMAGDDANLPRWAHLRPQFADCVQTNAYLNRLRMHEWRGMFETRMPGSLLVPNRSSREGAEAALQALQADGELASYAPEELLTHSLAAVWREACPGG